MQTSGTFTYPLCFTALLFAIGLMVLPSSEHSQPEAKAPETPTHQEPAAPTPKHPLNPRIAAELIARCDDYIRKYPDDERVENVVEFGGQVRIENGDWKAVIEYYRSIESQFPKSGNLDRYVFFQALGYFYETSFTEAMPVFDRFLKSFPKSELVESAMYYAAMTNFLGNKYNESLPSINDYLKKFPAGKYAGDMTYGRSSIYFNDRGEDQTEKIIRMLTDFATAHPADSANCSMFCLLGDIYKKKDRLHEAINAYKKAADAGSPDVVLRYALDGATDLMTSNKDWNGISEMHDKFIRENPNSQLVLTSVATIAKMKAREGKSQEAVPMISEVLKTHIADPTQEQVEYLLDELVKTLVPKKKSAAINADEIDKQLQDILARAVAGKENPTSFARMYYARARLAQLLKRKDRSDLFLKGIAHSNSKTPAFLSPALLSVCGDILLKTGDLDGAESMFKYLADHFKNPAFMDAGPVGLAYVELARKHPKRALGMFEAALNNPGNMRFKEASLGKLQALVELDRLDAAEKLALKIVTDKTFRGETTAKAYLLLGQVYRKQAAKAKAKDARDDLLKTAYATYQRVFIAYQAYPDTCADGYWQAWETAKELGDTKLADETLKALKDNPKLRDQEH